MLLTPQLQEQFEKLLASGIYINEACEYLGVSRATYYRWIKRGSEEIARLERTPKGKTKSKEKIYVDFYRAMRRAEHSPEVRALALWNNHMKKDWRAARDFLARRYPDRWSQRLEVTGAGGGPIEMATTIDVVALERKVLAILEAEDGKVLSGPVASIESIDEE